VIVFPNVVPYKPASDRYEFVILIDFAMQKSEKRLLCFFLLINSVDVMMSLEGKLARMS
jgi:hypothetical protein